MVKNHDTTEAITIIKDEAKAAQPNYARLVISLRKWINENKTTTQKGTDSGAAPHSTSTNQMGAFAAAMRHEGRLLERAAQQSSSSSTSSPSWSHYQQQQQPITQDELRRRRGTQPCYNWNGTPNSCARGDQCQFMHSVASNQSVSQSSRKRPRSPSVDSYASSQSNDDRRTRKSARPSTPRSSSERHG